MIPCPRPLVSLLWPAPPGERFALLVDGEATATAMDPEPAEPAAGRRPKPGGVVTVQATGAILHVGDNSGAGSGSTSC